MKQLSGLVAVAFLAGCADQHARVTAPSTERNLVHPVASAPAMDLAGTDTGQVIEWAEDTLGRTSGLFFAHVSGYWRVPTTPSQWSGSLTYSTWLGIDDGIYILQPVLFYSAQGGSNHWWLASEQCYYIYGTGAGGCTPGNAVSTGTGHLIYGSIDYNSSTSKWTVTTKDLNTNSTSTLTTTSFVFLNNPQRATGGAVETHPSAFSSCSNYPTNGVFFTGLSMKDQYNNPVTPIWWNRVTPNLTPNCGFNVTHTDTTVSLYHNPAPPALSSDSTNPSPPVQYLPFSLTLYGTGIDPATVEIVYSQPPTYPGQPGSETIPNGNLTNKTSTQVTVNPISFSIPGPVYFSVKNGEGGALSNYLTVTVTPMYH